MEGQIVQNHPLESFAAIVVAWSVVGGAIDFLLGKTGQERVKKGLKLWKERMSQVQWKSFGKEEALLCARTIDWAFGNFFSSKRIALLGGLMFVGYVLWFLDPYFEYDYDDWKAAIDVSRIYYIYYLPFQLIMFSISISITYYIAKISSKLVTRHKIVSLSTVSAALIAQYLMHCYFYMFSLLGLSTFLVEISYNAIHGKWDELHNGVEFYIALIKSVSISPRSQMEILFHQLGLPPYIQIIVYLMLFLFFGRVLLTAIFLLSFLAFPFQKAITILTNRIVESNKPVFTLVFGGIATITKSIQEIIKTTF
ncbi:hypothetical protein [Rhizobium leguminosarum]|uniref:hypothetical protein n=1 Tax=Rhizobium leguminosarum TaxID=384 RepID=UPI0014427071|nr:hypothetical protein [Rhizobium leguminosarum]NKL84512.1 hypothetical protein [Rhizobium leguminosarum bv. viciae]